MWGTVLAKTANLRGLVAMDWKNGEQTTFRCSERANKIQDNTSLKSNDQAIFLTFQKWVAGVYPGLVWVKGVSMNVLSS